MTTMQAMIMGTTLTASLAGGAIGGEPDFSDPANVALPPPHAIGFVRRDPNLDALPGFKEPPPGFGEVAFFWWLGDPLTQERLTWQLDQLAGKGVMGLQINYAHSDRGGHSYGLTFPSEPPLFSDAWWKLVGWFIQEAKKRGMAVSLSDYTLGIGQGWSVDEVLKKDPDLTGAVLQSQVKDAGAGNVQWPLPADTLMVAALDPATGATTDLRERVANGVLNWTAPGPKHRIVAVFAQPVQPSLDPMNPKSGPAYAARFFGQFEDHNPGEGGKGLNFFFSDELEFRVHGNLWTPRFAEEFRKRKGYDIAPELPALFHDAGPRTPKVRLDYSDVKVALTEAGFFKPVFDWHQQRGMIYGCDHGGRGRNVVEFGDYFRTQRWNQGPGCDQPHLGRDIVKNKVASSIAHLYLRPRTWIEGYYGSGWGTSSEQVADATFANLAQGQNLLTFHGLYYSTHGGWWEWAPPDNHWRMPYWAHMGELLKCTSRLSYLLSQGHHRCDVAILYPVAPMEAGLGGNEAVGAAFGTAEHLYRQGIDLDFIDFESVARAKVEEKELRVSGERYRVLILPAMRAVRWSTLQKALEFYRAGGLVLALGALPEASDRAGRDDAELNAAVKELFGDGQRVVTSPAQAGQAISKAFTRDFVAASGSPQFMHRRLGPRDVYMVYGAPQGMEFTFRATGAVELWDPWTGRAQTLPVLEQTAEMTRLRMPLTDKEAQIVVFGPGQPAKDGGRPALKAEALPIEGEWDCAFKPTMDNRWGDFRWPAFDGFIGPEARRFRYQEEAAANPGWEKPDVDDSKWPRVTYAFGPMFRQLGPLPADASVADLEVTLAAIRSLDQAAKETVGGKAYAWKPYLFSWRWGVEGDPGHQGYHGLKEEMYDEFIRLGRLTDKHRAYEREKEDGGTRYYLWTSVTAPQAMKGKLLVGGLKPKALWVNGQPVPAKGGTVDVSLQQGPNALLLRYDGPGTGYVVAVEPSSKLAGASADRMGLSDTTPWIWTPEGQHVASCAFRSRAFHLMEKPARASILITCDNGYTLYVNGKEIGSGSQWERVQVWDVASALRRGKNVMAVAAINQGDSAGLIAELRLGEGAAGKAVVTDGSWRCNTSPAGEWRGADYDDAAWKPATVVSAFAESLWFKHQMGPPKVEAGATTGGGATFGSLAMRWNGADGVLPFDVRPTDARPAGWYRFKTAPGTKAMTVTARGRVECWVNGKPCRREDLGGGRSRFQVTEPSMGEAVAALRIEQERGWYGGAALPEPVAFECVSGQIKAGDWSRMESMESYSGGLWYRKTVSLSTEQTKRRVFLDLGNVVSSAEVHVNGKVAGVRVAPPWRWDITDAVKAGENRIEVLVYNTLANHYTTIPTRYRGPLTAGLLGPGQIEVLAAGEPKPQ